jgi:hypothetical protein
LHSEWTNAWRRKTPSAVIAVGLIAQEDFSESTPLAEPAKYQRLSKAAMKKETTLK